MPPPPPVVSTTDFEENDGLEELTSEELEEQAFGPDPDQRRSRPKRSRRGRKKTTPTTALVAVAPAPATPAVVATKFCYACGAETDARAEVCPYCGVRQPVVPFQSGRRRAGGGDKSKGGATLLALTLGGLGAHRFYLGQPKVGLAMLLFCWTFLPALVGVVDFVRLAFMSDREFAERYGRQPPPLLVPPRSVRRLGRGPVRPDPEGPRPADGDEAREE